MRLEPWKVVDSNVHTVIALDEFEEGLVGVISTDGYCLDFILCRCQTGAFKMVPVPKQCLNIFSTKFEEAQDE